MGTASEQRQGRAAAAVVPAWLAGLAICVVAVTAAWPGVTERAPDWLAEASHDALPAVPLVLAGPLAWWLHRRRVSNTRRAVAWRAWRVRLLEGLSRRLGFGTRGGASRAGLFEWGLALGVFAASVAASVAVANLRVGGERFRFGELPPAYHDEYSYLFQAKTFLAGRTWFPTHPEAPQFFDQMHVLNDDGRYASRYFPGTGAWLAPFVAAGQPYWGHWLAGGLTAFFLFWSGRELGGNGVGLLAGLLTAAAPGMAIFSNLLLAHHPTLVGLSVFLYAFLRMLRTGGAACACFAGAGLAFSMLCRPMTAAGFGLPFGIVFIVWLLRPPARDPDAPSDPDARSVRVAAAGGRRRIALLAAMALPLLAAFGLLFLYNRSITSSGWQTPYGVYERIYTPRQVYGFRNVERGTPRVGPKVRRAYDEWAENLTPELAARNVGRRLLASWTWSLGLVPLAMAAVAFPFCAAAVARDGRFDRRWWLVPAGIASLHLAHVPYWFTGIMHWHYVFESGPLWLLLFAGVSGWLCSAWARVGRWALPAWWLAIAAVVSVSVWLPRAWFDPLAGGPAAVRSQIGEALEVAAFSRLKYQRFREEIGAHVEPPAIVFVDPTLEDAHIEYVVNEPQLSGAVLYARLLEREFERTNVLDAFGGRSAYWVVADDRVRTRLLSGGFGAYRFEHVGELPWRERRRVERRRVELWRVRGSQAAASTPAQTEADPHQ